MNLQSLIAEVAKSYWARSMIVFAGSGVSEAAGLPSRAELIRRLTGHAAKLGVNRDRIQEMVTLLQSGLWADALAELRDGLGTIEFGHCFEQYQKNIHTRVPGIARAIARLAPNLRAVLTPNMDFVLERAFNANWPSFANVTRDIAQRQRYILMLRGILCDQTTWVVTREDYHSARQDSERADVLTSLYHTYHMVFVCHDFSDFDIERVINRVGSSHTPQPPRHVALVPRGTTLYIRRALLNAAGIRIIELGTPDDGYADIAGFLHSVATQPYETGHRPYPRTSSGSTGAGASFYRKPNAAMKYCPFPGLECFSEDRAEYYFGRRPDISATLQLLGDTKSGHKRWLFIDGASGAGKSSLVQAGILPKVRQGHLVGTYRQWTSAIMRPGADPVSNLAHVLLRAEHVQGDIQLDDIISSLRCSENGLAAFLRKYTPAGHGFLLIVDQLEEVFFLASEQDRRTFDALLACALADKGGPLYLVTTMRSDFAMHFAELPLLEALHNREASRFYLKAMKQDSLTEAIVEPARRAGLEWDEHLVERILWDARHSGGSLPLVAHVLQALWLKRDGNRLTLAAYEELGGVAGVLTHSADTILYSLSEQEQQLARTLLLCLARVGPRGAYTRRPVYRHKALRAAGGGRRAERILIRLSGGRDGNKPSGVPRSCARLLAVTRQGDKHRVDLVHEALLDSWKTFSRWLDENRKELLVHDDLQARLVSWQRAGASPRSLPSGAELAYLCTYKHLADDEELMFLELAEQKQNRARLRLQMLVGFLVVCVVSVSWLARYAFSLRAEASTQRDLIREQRDLLSKERDDAQQPRVVAKSSEEQVKIEKRKAELGGEEARDAADRARESTSERKSPNETPHEFVGRPSGRDSVPWRQPKRRKTSKLTPKRHAGKSPKCWALFKV